MGIEITIDVNDGMDMLKMSLASEGDEHCRLLLTTVWLEIIKNKETGLNETYEQESSIWIEPDEFISVARGFRLMADLIERFNQNK